MKESGKGWPGWWTATGVIATVVATFIAIVAFISPPGSEPAQEVTSGDPVWEDSEETSDYVSPNTESAETTPPLPVEEGDNGNTAYLSEVPNLTGDYVNAPKGLYIGKNFYVNGTEIACINYDGGGHARYDVSQYESMKGTLGLPSDVDDMDGATCAVTFTNQGGEKLESTFRFSAGSGPVQFELTLDDVTQLNVTCVLEYPRDKGTKHLYVAIGDAKLTG